MRPTPMKRLPENSPWFMDEVFPTQNSNWFTCPVDHCTVDDMSFVHLLILVSTSEDTCCSMIIDDNITTII